MKIKWEITPMGNYILNGKGFFISYNSNPGGGISMFDGDYGSDETAIVTDKGYSILNGDFREEYEKLVPEGLDACIDFYKKHEEDKSSWSSE